MPARCILGHTHATCRVPSYKAARSFRALAHHPLPPNTMLLGFRVNPFVFECAASLVVDGLWLPGMHACIAIKFTGAGAHEIRASRVAVRSYRPFVLCIHWQFHRLQKHCPMVSITVKHTSFKHQFNHQMVIETPVACLVWCNSSHTASDCILLLLAASGNFWLPLTLTKSIFNDTNCHSNNGTNHATAYASSCIFMALLCCSHHMSR